MLSSAFEKWILRNCFCALSNSQCNGEVDLENAAGEIERNRAKEVESEEENNEQNDGSTRHEGNANELEISNS